MQSECLDLTLLEFREVAVFPICVSGETTFVATGVSETGTRYAGTGPDEGEALDCLQDVASVDTQRPHEHPRHTLHRDAR